MAAAPNNATRRYLHGLASAELSRCAALARSLLRPALLTRLTAVAVLLTVGIGLLAAPVPSAVGPSPREQARKLLREAAKDIEDGEGHLRNRALSLRNRALCDIAVLQVQLGDREAAQETFRKLRALTDAMPEGIKYWEWRVLSRSLARAGEMDAVLRLAKDIPSVVPNYRGKEGGFRDMVLQEGATELAGLGRGKDARRLMAAIADKETRDRAEPRVLTRLAHAQAKAGHAAEALRTADGIKDDWTRVRALAGVIYGNPSVEQERPEGLGIVLIQAEAGDRVGARRTLRRAEELASGLKVEKERGLALATVACAWVRLGDLVRAAKLAREVESPWRDFALSAVARAQVAAGKTKEAAKTVEPITDPERKIEALLQMGAGLVRSGDREGAKKLFLRAYHIALGLPEQKRHLPMIRIGSALAVAGDYKDALESAKQLLASGSAEFLIYYHMAQAQAKAGHFQEARTTADELLKNDESYASALQQIAALQAEHGDAAGALAWARRLPGLRERGQALLGVAEGLVRRAEKRGK